MKALVILWGIITCLSLIMCVNAFLYELTLSQAIVSGSLVIASSI